MQYDIDFINTMPKTVDWSEAAEAEWAAGNDKVGDEYTVKFEQEFADAMRGCDSDDIGGLVVYTNAGSVRAVYDYENFCGWIVK